MRFNFQKIFMFGLCILSGSFCHAEPVSSGSLQQQVSPDVQKQNEAIEKQTNTLKTIQAAVKDLKDPDVEVRIAAAQLLGKYDFILARKALIGSLEDQSARVRRAVAVSLTERFLLEDVKDCEELLARLGDEDVEVRRTISNSLPYLSHILSSNRIVVIRGNNPPRQQYILSNKLRGLLTGAFEDEDEIVRLNIIRYHRMFNIYPKVSSLEKLLEDKNREIVILTLDKLYRIEFNERIRERIAELAKSDDAVFRKEIANLLLRKPDANLLETLEQLAGDENPLTRIAAKLAIYKAPYSRKRYDANSLADDFNAVTKESNDLINLLYQLYPMGKDAEVVFQKLTGHDLSRVRSVAWREYLEKSNLAKTETWMVAMEDSSVGVRRQVQDLVNRKRIQLDEDVFEKLGESGYSDVRQFAVRMLHHIPKEDSSSLVMNFMIDQNIDVRLNALRLIYKNKADNWQLFLERSLHDSNLRMQQEAARLLINSGPNGISVLEEFIKDKPREPIAIYIQNLMARQGGVLNVN